MPSQGYIRIIAPHDGDQCNICDANAAFTLQVGRGDGLGPSIRLCAEHAVSTADSIASTFADATAGGVYDKHPYSREQGGRGVQAQRDNETLASDSRPQAKAASTGGGIGGQGVQAQRTLYPEQLRAPFPYPGGKARHAPDVWARLGNVDVYAEPFAGSLAILLASPYGPARREIVCDLEGMVANYWRAVRYDPEGVAFFADWPTIHDDLTARRNWLRRWSADNIADIRDDSEFYDAQAAGYWCWALSNWIGGPGDLLASRPSGALTKDKIPTTAGGDSPVGGKGVQAQRDALGPAVYDYVPSLSDNSTGGKGVQAQRTTLDSPIRDSRPCVPGKNLEGRGVQAARVAKRFGPAVPEETDGESVNDQIPATPGGSPMGGRWVSAQSVELLRDSIPRVSSGRAVNGAAHGGGGGNGVQAQRTTLGEPVLATDKMPVINGPAMGGKGVSTQRTDALAYDKCPHVNSGTYGQGVQAQRTELEHPIADGDALAFDARPFAPGGAQSLAGHGVQAGRVSLPATGYYDGARLLPWFRALAHRLACVVVLSRSWESAVTPAILGMANPNLTIGVVLDPPYLTEGRSGLYASDAAGTSDNAALASLRWAFENGERCRIAYVADVNDYPRLLAALGLDALPEGWTWGDPRGMKGGRGSGKADVFVFSPACLDPDADTPQQGSLL